MNNHRIRRRLTALLAACMMVLVMSVSAFAGQLGLTLKLSVQGEGADQANAVLENSSVEVIVGDQGGTSLLNLFAHVMGMDIVKVLAEISSESIAFSMPDLDPNRYEYPVQNLVEKLKDSFNLSMTVPGGDSYAINQMPAAGPAVTPEEYQEALMPYLQFLMTQIGEKIQVSANAAIEMKQLGVTETGTLYVYEPSPEDLAGLFDGLASMLSNDPKLMAIVNKWADYLRSLEGVTALAQGVDDDLSAAQLADEFTAFFTELPQILTEGAESVRQGYGDNGGYIRFSVGLKADGSFCYFKAQASEGDTDLAALGCELSGDQAHQKNAFFVTGEGTDYVMLFDGTSNGSLRIGTVTIKTGGYEIGHLVYNWDLSQHSELLIPYGTCVIDAAGANGSLVVTPSAQGGTDHILTLTGLENLTDTEEFSGFTLTMHSTTDVSPIAPTGTPVDLSSYTDEQLTQLFGELVNKFLSSVGMAP